MTMEDDGDGECLALSLYVFIYGTVSYLFGLKNASSRFFFLNHRGSRGSERMVS